MIRPGRREEGGLIDRAVQTLIAVTGPPAVFLVNSPWESARGWGAVIGLISQPAWLYATASAGQWGSFISALAFTVGWAFGAAGFLGLV